MKDVPSVSLTECMNEVVQAAQIGPQRVREILEAFKAETRKKAQNRPLYFDSFIAEWRRSSGLIETAIEAFRNGRVPEKLNDETTRLLLAPYGCLFPVVYRYLIDDLTYEEKRAFENVLAHTAEVWRLFFDAAKAHHPELGNVADEGVRASSAALAETRALYLGETERALTPTWGRAVDALGKSVEQIFQEVAK